MPRKQRSQKKQEAEVEPAVTIRGAKRLYNILVERGQVKLTIEQGIQMLEGMYKQMGREKRVYACAACGIKIGLFMCFQCPRTTDIRYCGRECQDMAWPAHKQCCRRAPVEDVE